MVTSAATRQARDVEPVTPTSPARPAWSASRCHTWWANSRPTTAASTAGSASHPGFTYSRHAGSVAMVDTLWLGTVTRA